MLYYRNCAHIFTVSWSAANKIFSKNVLFSRKALVLGSTTTPNISELAQVWFLPMHSLIQGWGHMGKTLHCGGIIVRLRTLLYSTPVGYSSHFWFVSNFLQKKDPSRVCILLHSDKFLVFFQYSVRFSSSLRIQPRHARVVDFNQESCRLPCHVCAPQR